MTKEDNAVEGQGGAGCLIFFGAVIVAICIGSIYDALHSWLAFGSVLMLWGVLGAISAAAGRK